MSANKRLGPYMDAERAPATKGRKTASWLIRNIRSEAELGMIFWSGAWRQYIFAPAGDDVIFSAGCLRDLAVFLDEVRAIRERPE